MNTIPEYNTETVCLLHSCNAPAVALQVPGSAVYWCENGHVFVRDPNVTVQTKLVHEFKPEDLEAGDVPPDDDENNTTECPQCRGSGMHNGVACDKCGGFGYFEE
jgi:hypothetical protein